MPKGFGFVNKAAAETAAKGGSSLWGGKLIFKLPNDGDKAVVRFVEIDDEHVYGAWHHQVPVEGRSWPDLVVCIAQDEDGNHTDDACPGCERDLPLKFKGYTALIWRDGPVYKTDDKNKIVKDNLGDPVVLEHKDGVAIWSSGPRLFENLGEIHEAYGGLDSRDFTVKRRGVKTDTQYTIVPADPDGGKKAMSAADKKLVKDAELDLAAFIRPPSYDEFEARLNGQAFVNNSDDEGGKPSADSESAAAKNPFKRRK